MIIGYTNGYFDLFHVGHLNLLQRASKLCDRLIVGVISDEECVKRKGKRPIIPFEQRLRIVDNIYRVGLAVPVYDDDKFAEWKKYRFNVLFVGSDHQEEMVWKGKNESITRVVYLPYTKEISSTLIKERIICEFSKD